MNNRKQGEINQVLTNALSEARSRKQRFRLQSNLPIAVRAMVVLKEYDLSVYYHMVAQELLADHAIHTACKELTND